MNQKTDSAYSIQTIQMKNDKNAVTRDRFSCYDQKHHDYPSQQQQQQQQQHLWHQVPPELLFWDNPVSTRLHQQHNRHQQQ